MFTIKTISSIITIKTISSIITAGGLTFIISNNSKEISDYLTSKLSTMYNYFVKTIIIKNDFNSTIVTDAVMDHIQRKKQSDVFQLSDGLNYQTLNGKFIFEYNKKNIYIDVASDKITLSVYCNMNVLKQFVAEIYNNYNKKDNVLYYHTSNNGTFKLGLPKRPRKFPTLTNSMNNMILNVDHFMNKDNKLEYDKKGIPHRRGYLIHGLPGTGKSAIVEYIATKYDMNPYVIVFNDNNMTDSTLITLFNSVPRDSIILIDEMDKQLETLNMNKNKQLHYAGILSAMAGAERLSDTVIIILTANDINKIDIGLKQSLLRTGRIDQVFEFTEQFIQTI